MKQLKIVSAVFFMLISLQAKSQSTVFDKPDHPAKCKNIRDGKFLRANYPEGIWYMTIKENLQTEYFNNGKDYVKSTLVFIDDCNYKAIIIEKSDKNDPVQVGDVFNNKIVETQGNLLKVQSKVENTQFEIVYEKAEK